MSLNWPIFSVVSNKSFWTDYYWFMSSAFAEGYTELVNHKVPVTEYEAEQLRQYNIELSTWDYCRLDVPLGQYAMCLQFHPAIDEVNLSICDHEGNSFQLGWDDCAHWHPHVLRWEELDLICMCVACLDARLPHPGIPLLLFCRFAPVTDSEDAEWALSLLRSAGSRWSCSLSRRLISSLAKSIVVEAVSSGHWTASTNGYFSRRKILRICGCFTHFDIQTIRSFHLISLQQCWRLPSKFARRQRATKTVD